MPEKEYTHTESYYIPLDITIEFPVVPKKKSKIKYYIFCIRWFWKNRHWKNNRQKFKALERELSKMNKRKDKK